MRAKLKISQSGRELFLVLFKEGWVGAGYLLTRPGQGFWTCLHYPDRHTNLAHINCSFGDLGV